MDSKKIQNIISKGEGLRIEFKKAKNKLPNNLFETVCAFLNKNGGEILLGIDDNKNIEGINEKIAEQLVKEIANLSSNPQKLFPSFLLEPKIIDFQGKKIIYIFVPTSSQVHKTANKIYDRNIDGDFILQTDTQIKQLYFRKSSEYTENKIYPFLTEDDFAKEIVLRTRKIIRINRPNHPWNELTNDEFYRIAGLYRKDYITGEEGFTMSALLLFGKSETIGSAVPHYKIDAMAKIVDTNRYDDRINIRCNLITAYDRLMEFVEKHLADKFYLQGSQRISLREKIFREIVANILIHREYANAFPTSFVIYKDRVVCKNANKPYQWGELKPGNFEPFPKNPHIAQIFTQMGRSEELGTGINNVYRYNKIYSNVENNEFIEEDIFVTTIPLEILNDELNDELNDGQKKVYLYIKKYSGKMAKHISSELNIPFGTVDRHIRVLLKLELIERRGSKKTGGYYVL